MFDALSARKWSAIAGCMSIAFVVGVAAPPEAGGSLPVALPEQSDVDVTEEAIPPMPARRFDQQEEGSSMRRMIAQFSAPIRDEARWQVFYDDASGFPYYYDTVTKVTQWDNPWATRPEAVDASETLLESSWGLYEKFRFRGVFDDLTSIRSRRRLPRADASPDAMRAIAAMAGMQFDVAQARLEVALLKAETRSGTIRTLLDDGAHDLGDAERIPEAHAPAVHHEAQAGDDEGAEGEVAMLLGLAGEDEEEEETEVEQVHAELAAAGGGGGSAQRRLSHPPADTRSGERVALAGGWNDLGNMWYARGEWELALECFRRSLFWNPEQTATLINLTSLLVKLGFEGDAAVVWDYFVDVEGGTMGGWTAEREEALVASIESGLQLAQQLPGGAGRTLGELRLAGVVPSAEAVQAAAASAAARADLDAVLATALQPGGPGKAAEDGAQVYDEGETGGSVAPMRRSGVAGSRRAEHGAGLGSARPQLLPETPLADLSTRSGANTRIRDVGIAQRAPAPGRGARAGLREYARSVRARLAQEEGAMRVVLQRSWLWGVVPLSDDPSRPFKDIVGWLVAICLFAAMLIAGWTAFQPADTHASKSRGWRSRLKARKPKTT